MSQANLTSGNTTLTIDSTTGLAALYLIRDGQPCQVMSGQEFLSLRMGDDDIPVRITSATGGYAIDFTGELPGMPHWRIKGRVIPGGDLAARFNWHIRVQNLGEDLAECSAHVKFQVNDSGVPRWMVPAMFYKHNRPETCVRRYPRYSFDELNPDEFISPYWAFRSDRSSCPSVFCWTDNFTSCVAVPERFGDEMTGLGFRGDASGTYLMLNFPYVEEPVKYSFCREDGNAPERTKTVIFPGGQMEFNFSTFVAERDLHAYDGFVRDAYDESEDETNPWMTKAEAEEALAYGLYHWHYDPDKHVLYETCSFDKYFGKKDRNVDRPHMHVAWVSGAPYAHALMCYGMDNDIKEYVDAGVSVLNKIAQEGMAPSGFFYAEWTEESGWGTGWNPNKEWVQARTIAEATWFYAQALKSAKGLGLDTSSWEKALRSNLDSALKIQRDDGNFGSYYNVTTGVVEEWDGAAGLMWIPALLAAADLFGEGAYREAAIRAGVYYSRFVEDEYIYGAPEDVHLTPTSEDGYNAVIAFTHLYEAAKDSRWLALAKSAADWTCTFRWVYNTKFSDNSILGKYEFHTMGGDIASPSNNHLHNYGLICVPEFLRLWQYTGDTYYLGRASDHIACFHQFIAREDGDFNARKGMITEQWFHTDWTHAKGSMLQLAHCWCAGLILYADRCVREFGDIVIDARGREVYVLDSPWIESTEDADPDVVFTITNPSHKDMRLSVRHSKLGMVGVVEIPAMEEVRVLVGGLEPKVEILVSEGEIWS